MRDVDPVIERLNNDLRDVRIRGMTASARADVGRVGLAADGVGIFCFFAAGAGDVAGRVATLMNQAATVSREEFEAGEEMFNMVDISGLCVSGVAEMVVDGSVWAYVDPSKHATWHMQQLLRRRPLPLAWERAALAVAPVAPVVIPVPSRIDANKWEEYRRTHVEQRIHGGELVEYDCNQGVALSRRPATDLERVAYRTPEL